MSPTDTPRPTQQESTPDPDGPAAAEGEVAEALADGGPAQPVREQSVGRASALMAAGTMVSRVLGLVRNAMLIWCVGSVTMASSAFQTANNLPNIVYILVSGGLLNAILIPQITKAMARPDGGQDVVDRLLTACFAVIAALTVLVTAFAAPLVWLYGLSGATAALGLSFALLCLPQVFFYGTYAILGQVLNARGSYAAFMWTPVLANVVQIAGMAAFLLLYDDTAALPPEAWSPGMIWLLGGSATLGIVVQALALVPALRATGFRWRPRWGFRGYGFRAASAMAGWAFAALMVAQLGGWMTYLAMNVVKGRPDAGHVAGLMIYNVTFLVFMLPHSVITTSIITALYPRMSRAANAGDTGALRALLTRGLTTPSVALVPITAAALVLAVPGLAVMQPGLIKDGSLREAAIVFGLMIVGVIPFGWTTLQQRFLFATEDGRTNLYLSGLLVVVQVAFAGLALIGPAEHAVALIAIGQTLGNLAAAVAFILVAQRRVGGLPLRAVIRLHVRLILVSTLAGLITWGVVEGIIWFLGSTYLSFVVQLAVGGLLFVALFVVLARAFHLREVDDLISPVTTRLRRRTSGGATA